MKLRDYQQALINKCRYEFQHGKRRVILLSPTGSGKTVTAAELARLIIAKGGTVYFVVHRSELLRQAEETFNEWGILGVKCFMVQTLANRLTDNPEPTVLIFDEAHHSSCNTYRKIIDYYKNSWVLGLTATPARMSGDPLGSVFDSIVEEITAKELIKQGYLADYDLYCPKVAEFGNITLRNGDFDTTELFTIMDKPKIYGDILDHYRRLCEGRKTIVYCATIEHSRRIVDLFNAAGYKAVHLDGDTPEKQRIQIDKDFKAGKYDIISNVSLLGEGYNVPDCDCVLLLRRTLSLSLFIQMSTRCLRPLKNKRAIILDFTGSVYIHGMPTDDRSWSLDKKMTARNSTGEPDILCRQCKSCLRVYGGSSRICPYCKTEQPKTLREIEEEKAAELERITAIERRNKQIEQGKAKTMDELIKIGKERGYKSPAYWARMVYNGRARQ